MIRGILAVAGATLAFFGAFFVVDSLLPDRQRRRYGRTWHLVSFVALMVAGLTWHVAVAPGVILDARGAVVATAVLFEGLPAGIAVTAAGIAYRAAIGGAGAGAGMAGLVLDLALVAAAAFLVRRFGRKGAGAPRGLALFAACGAAAGTGEALSLLLIPPPEAGLAYFRESGTALFAVQLVCTVLIGALGRLLWEGRILEAERAKTQARYIAAIESSMDGFALIDLDGRILEVNETLCRMSGRPRAEILERRLSDFAVSPPGRTVSTRMQDLLRSGRGLWEAGWRHPDGTVFDVEVSVSTTRGSTPLFAAFLRDITERKRNDRALEESRRRAWALFHLAPLNGVLYDVVRTGDGTIVDWKVSDINESAAKSLGVAPGDVIGRQMKELIGEEAMAPMLEATRRVEEKGPGAPFQSHFPGNGKHYLSSLFFLGTDQVAMVSIDVTDEVEARDALRESERRFRLLAENTSDVIWLLDVATLQFTYTSPSVLGLRGYTPREVLAQPIEEVLTPESLAKVSGMLRANAAAVEAGDESRRTAVTEISQPRKDGTVVETEVVTTLLSDPSGRVTQVLGVTRDISARRRTERELRIKENALASSLNAIAMAGLDGLLTYVNATFVRKWGYDAPAEVLGRPFLDFWQRSAAVLPALEELLEGKPFVGELEARRKDGSTFPAQVQANRVEDADGSPICVLGTFHDVSERKAREDQLGRLNRMYLVLSHISEAIVHETDAPSLKQRACRIFVEGGGFKMAWIGAVDASRAVVPEARFGDDAGYVSSLRIALDDPAARLGPTASAICEGRTVVVEDFLSSPTTAPWREQAIRAGIRSSIAIPLRGKGRVTGALMVYAEQEGFFGDREIALLEETAAELSFAFDVLAREGERRAALFALEVSEGRLRFLLSATPAIIYTLDPSDFSATFVSENVSAVLGHSPSDFLSRKAFWMENVHPDDAAAALASAARTGGGDAVVCEYRFRHRDGRWIWMWEESRLVPGGEGRPSEIVGCWLDVTQRKQAEEALRSREETFATIVGQSLDSIALVDPANGRFVEFNEAAHRDLGYTREEFAEMGIGEIQAEHSGDEIRGNIARILGEGSASFETRHRRKDGEIRTVHVRARLLAVRDGSYVAAAWTDVTESKRLTEALRANQARLEEAQTLALLGSWSLDAGTGVLTRSSEIYRIFERSEAEWGASTEAFFSAVHPDDRPRVALAYRRSLDEGTEDELDHRIVVAGGRVKWVRAHWRVELGPGGTAQRAAGTIQDITDHVLAREARSLAEAKEAAEAANRAKSAFLASMSHEIRTPLNAVLGFSQLLLGDTGLTSRQQEQLRAINRSGEHLLTLINDILEMSKIEAGRVTLSPADSDLADLLWDLETVFRLRTAEKGLSLVFDRSPELPRHVVTDEMRLRQILLNLIGNAVKFTSTGGVTVRVKCEEAGEAGLRLFVDVEDTGPGIPEEDLPRLFERFEQARAGREARTGTGLGLAISRGIARLMGGDIRVRSRPGSGSVFTVEVPVERSSSPPSREVDAAKRIERIASGGLRRRILVADDIAENREVLVGMLSRVGFDVRTANDGKEALDLFSSWGPDLVLMDIRMPVLDGLEAIRRIRALPEGRAVPIVAVTASSFEEDRRATKEAGCDGFVAKPFRETELLETIGALLETKWVLASEGAAPHPRARSRGSALREVPAAMRTAILAATARGDLDRILLFADELLEEAPEAGELLRELAERFEYDRIRELMTDAAAGRRED